MPPVSRKRRKPARSGAAIGAGAHVGGGAASVQRAAVQPAAAQPGARSGRRSSAERDALARAALRPLGPGERPLPLKIAVAVVALLAIAIPIGAASNRHLRADGGSWYGAVFLTVVFAADAIGMWRRRYWAVLGFEALLAFQVVATSLALVVASTVLAAILCVLSITLGGGLFWKLIRVMGRIQTLTR